MTEVLPRGIVGVSPLARLLVLEFSVSREFLYARNHLATSIAPPPNLLHRRRDSVPRQYSPVCRGESPPAGPRDGRKGCIREEPDRRIFPARTDGDRDSGAVWWRRRQVFRSDSGSRGTFSRGRFCR